MFKKICSVFIFITIITMLSIPSFAAGKDVIYDSSTSDTGQFLVTITRPDGNESTFKKSYVVCGSSSLEGIRVELYRNSGGTYVPFRDTDNEYSFDIGSSGIFMKEVELNEGANNIRIVAYKKSVPVGELKTGESLQINTFTVTKLSESIKDKIKNDMLRVTDMLKDAFSKLK